MRNERLTEDIEDIEDVETEMDDDGQPLSTAKRLVLEDVSFHIKGLTRHLQHNGALADPTNKFAQAMRAITSKSAKKKTDADYAALNDLEWEGGLYVNEDGRVIVPGLVLEGALWEGGKHFRMGSLVRSSITIPEDALLIYNGPKSIDALRKDPRFRCRDGVKNPSTGARLMRTRPKFDQWELKFTVKFRPDMIDRRSIIDIVKVLGTNVGLSDDRHRMGGRFELIGAWDANGREIDID